MTFFPHLSSGDGPDIEALLRAAPPDEVQAAFEAFDGSDLTTQARAELVHARGARTAGRRGHPPILLPVRGPPRA